ncbi:M23 family metallopeptidase [Cutibacterium granulosum]|uniref:M23 family metallopeptidase n=1 Tax=Cutibacterium granulosum TaxID=33011 RepID=UPI002B22C45C|nr:M23 family metallopeptidase [Cutibacterium granulosum]MEA5644693.1 M23 family metallopeptidase [Cutibacterium granulosum]MEA5650013.1 M23 family metallopeptidase [Cutibacterium granulosum]MEA5657073.1 M23 family metallopeptidase [Cutibacterium granulosum]
MKIAPTHWREKSQQNTHLPSTPRGGDAAQSHTPFTDQHGDHPHARRGIAAVAVAALGLISVGGIWINSSAHSSVTNANSMMVDTTRPDDSKAIPEPQAAGARPGSVSDDKSLTNPTAHTKDGGLAALDGHGSTVSRSAVRTELDRAMNRSMSAQRHESMTHSTKDVMGSATEVSEKVRADELDAAIKDVRANAAKIAAEKKAAEKRMREEAARQKQQQAADKSETSATDGKKADDDAATSVATSGGATTPIPAGMYHIGARFGEVGSWARYHTGTDFVASCGTPVVAATSGIVGQPTGGSWAGNNIVIHHANGGSTLHAHLSSVDVHPGQAVKAGQHIGAVGETGRAFGCHLHYEYYPAGTTPGDVYSAKDALEFLRGLGAKL